MPSGYRTGTPLCLALGMPKTTMLMPRLPQATFRLGLTTDLLYGMRTNTGHCTLLVRGLPHSTAERGDELKVLAPKRAAGAGSAHAPGTIMLMIARMAA